jgi:chromosome segregation ATPase
MPDNRNQKKGELAKAESTLREFEAKLQQTNSLLEERKRERIETDLKVQEAAASGDINLLMSLQSRLVAIDKSINDLKAAGGECAQRVESARRYLYTLYVRLERLRQEAADLRSRLSLLEHEHRQLRDEETSLMRLKVQIEAIAGIE